MVRDKLVPLPCLSQIDKRFRFMNTAHGLGILLLNFILKMADPSVALKPTLKVVALCCLSENLLQSLLQAISNLILVRPVVQYFRMKTPEMKQEDLVCICAVDEISLDEIHDINRYINNERNCFAYRSTSPLPTRNHNLGSTGCGNHM